MVPADGPGEWVPSNPILSSIPGQHVDNPLGRLAVPQLGARPMLVASRQDRFQLLTEQRGTATDQGPRAVGAGDRSFRVRSHRQTGNS